MKDLGKAFSFPFNDPGWATKFLIAAAFMLLSVIGLGLFVLAGYLVQVTQRVMKHEESVLPEWSDVGIKFITGVKFAVVYFLYLLPVIILSALFAVLILITALGAPSEATEAAAGVYTFGFLLVVIPYSVALSILLPIISYRFAAHEKIGEALDISAVIADFRKHWQSTVIVALIAIGIESLAAVGMAAFIVGVLFTLFYAYLVSAYLHGALYIETTTAESQA